MCTISEPYRCDNLCATGFSDIKKAHTLQSHCRLWTAVNKNRMDVRYADA